MPSTSGGADPRGALGAPAPPPVHSAEEHLRAFVEHAVFGIIRTAPDGTIVMANRAFATMLGYEAPRELLGCNAGILYLHGSDRLAFLRRVEAVDQFAAVEETLVRKDGSAIRVRTSGRTVHDQTGRVEAVESIVENVTTRHQLEDRLRQAQKMEAIGQLASGIAHDINTLLAVIQTSCELLAQGLPPESQLQDELAAAQQAVSRGSALTKKLLTIGRKAPFDPQPVRAATLVGEFAQLVRRIVPRSIFFNVRAVVRDLAICADAGAIEQALLNLVRNARDAMPEGGVLTLDIERVTLEPEQMPVAGALTPRAFAVFSVTDSGVGMDETTVRHAFEPFFTTKPPGEGTGLGLAAVFGIARQHGGFAEIDSRLGQGTTVRMYIPAVPLPPHLDTPHTPQPAVRGGIETIAVVEDSEPLRRLTTRVLETAGYTVHALASGKEALVAFGALAPPPDLILSDILMPGMSGVQFLGGLRDEGWTTPMLFTSGDPEHHGRTQPSLPPGIPVLAKPWTVDDLLREVRHALDDSRRISS